MNFLSPEEQDKASLDRYFAWLTRYASSGTNVVVLRWMEAKSVKILTDLRANIARQEKTKRDDEAVRVHRIKPR